MNRLVNEMFGCPRTLVHQSGHTLGGSDARMTIPTTTPPVAVGGRPSCAPSRAVAARYKISVRWLRVGYVETAHCVVGISGSGGVCAYALLQCSAGGVECGD